LQEPEVFATGTMASLTLPALTSYHHYRRDSAFDSCISGLAFAGSNSHPSHDSRPKKKAKKPIYLLDKRNLGPEDANRLAGLGMCEAPLFFYLERVFTMLWLRTSPKRRVGLSHSARPPSKLALRLECLEDRTVPSFIPTTYTLTDTGPRDVVTADFRNLGTQDIAVANRTSSTVSVLLNNNDGTGTFAPAVSYPTLSAGRPLGMAAGDLDGDGFADIVVANYGGIGGGGTTVSILYNNPASPGTFMAPVNLDVGDDYVASVKLASLLGDGLLDIITANASSNPTGTVSVLLQDRNNPGTFLPPVTYATGPAGAAGNSPQGLAVADFFGDGMASVAVGDAITSKVTVLRNDPANPGHLLPYTVVGTAPGSVLVGLAAGDLGTGGGNTGLSLVSASPGADKISVFVNDGLGNFSAPVNYSTGAGAHPLRVAIGQVGQASGNPYNDVVTANTGTAGPGRISILYGNGDGTLRSAVTVPSGGDGPAGVAIADFEGDFAGDGLNDIVVANFNSNNVTVLLQTPPAPTPPRAAPPGSVWGTINGDYTAPIGIPVPADFSPLLTVREVGSHGTAGLMIADGGAPTDTFLNLSAADGLFADPLLGGRLGWELL
jgi:hypothetical protein